jgi:hypothetical protein
VRCGRPEEKKLPVGLIAGRELRSSWRARIGFPLWKFGCFGIVLFTFRHSQALSFFFEAGLLLLPSSGKFTRFSFSNPVMNR